MSSQIERERLPGGAGHVAAGPRGGAAPAAPGAPAAEGGCVVGARTDDRGVERDGRRKENFQPGYELRAKVTVLAEGPRGSLTKQLLQKFSLEAGCNPQVYAIGVKEIWEVPAGRVEPGTVWPTT